MLRAKGNSLRMREDLESKLSVALANMEMELRLRCTVHKCEDGKSRGYLNLLAPNEEVSDIRLN